MSSAPMQARSCSEPAATDTQLVQKCLLGEEPAWIALVDRYKNLVFSIPIKYGFPREEATDIFQEVCLDLVCELSRIRDPQALAAWLIRVTHHKCFHHNKQRVRDELNDPEAQELAVVSEQVPEALMNQLEQDQHIRKAVRELSPRCRELVEHLFFELPAKPYHEVAKGLGVAIGSIGFIRRRCLNKLRDRLEELGVR
jgi:RNA polymerase sigma factor (sigma-70 family)